MIFIILFILVTLLLLINTTKTPAVAMVGVWCMYALEQWAQGSNLFFLKHNSLINITIGSIVLIGLLVKIIKGNSLLKHTPRIIYPILFLFIYSIISINWAPRADLSYENWIKYAPYFVTFILLTPLLISKENDFKSVFNVFYMVGGIAVYSLLFEVEWFHRRIVFVGGRLDNSLMGNPLAVAQMAGYLFFVCMFLLRNTVNNKFGFLLNIVKIAISALCLLLIVKSGSRGQLLGLIAVFIIFYPLNYKVTSIKGFILTTIIIAIVVSAVTWGLGEFWEKSNRWDQDQMESSMGGRFDNAFVLLAHWYRDILTIVFGLGSSASYDPKIIGMYPHFVPFEVLGEEGLIGFVVYIKILFMTFGISYRLYKATKNSIVSRQIFVILMSMAAYSFILSLKQGSLLGNIEFFMGTIILAKYELIIKNKETLPL